MRIKAVTFKLSFNNDNLFNLRKQPEALKEMIYSHIRKSIDNRLIKNSFIYAYQIISETSVNNNNLLSGRLIKYQEINEHEIWDDVKKQIVKSISENEIIDKVHFIYSKEYEYFIVEDRSTLNSDLFREAITYILNLNHIDFRVELNPILNEVDVKRRILEFEKIRWSHFEIIPNNPNGNKLWSAFENIGEGLKSTCSKFEFENQDSGLEYNEMLEELIEDVNQGRGRKFIIGGEDLDGKYDEVRSHDHIKRHYKNVSSSDQGRINGLWEIVKEILDL